MSLLHATRHHRRSIAGKKTLKSQRGELKIKRMLRKRAWHRMKVKERKKRQELYL
jgi:hypothetical protein